MKVGDSSLESLNANLTKSIKFSLEDDLFFWSEILFYKNIATKLKLPISLKLGGASSLTDLYLSKTNNIDNIILPMIESKFMLEKSIDNILKLNYLGDKTLLIESINLINVLPKIIDKINFFDNITIGRSDLSKSMNIENVNDYKLNEEIITLLKSLKKNYQGKITIGGQISYANLIILKNNKLFDYFDYIETRNFIMDKNISQYMLNKHLLLEIKMMKNFKNDNNEIINFYKNRENELKKRIN